MTNDEKRKYFIEKAKEEGNRREANQERPLTREGFAELMGISRNDIEKVFPVGCFTELAKLAGIPRAQGAQQRYSAAEIDELIATYHSIVEKEGRLPSARAFGNLTIYSETIIYRIWKTIRAFHSAYAKWLRDNDHGSPAFKLLEKKYGNEVESLADNEISPEGRTPTYAATLSAGAGAFYGDYMDFRGLKHEPVNEQGVVYLFALVAKDLDFTVEAIRSECPDCLAKRRVKRGRKMGWTDVRIEFEYMSRTFLTPHNHELNKCDIIVCWENNWPDCPLEVIELKSKIKTLTAT